MEKVSDVEMSRGHFLLLPQQHLPVVGREIETWFI